MSEEFKRKCGKGWLVAPSETDGEYVPFFIHVRDKDIVWNLNNLNQDFQKIFNRDEYENIELQYPYCNACFIKDKWNGEFNSNLRYNADAMFNLRNNGILSEDGKIISFNIDLPFITLVKDFNIQFSKNTDNIDVIQSSIYKVPSIGDKISSVEINLYNFISAFNQLSAYSNDDIYVHISGNISLSDY